MAISELNDLEVDVAYFLLELSNLSEDPRKFIHAVTQQGALRLVLARIEGAGHPLNVVRLVVLQVFQHALELLRLPVHLVVYRSCV